MQRVLIDKRKEKMKKKQHTFKTQYLTIIRRKQKKNKKINSLIKKERKKTSTRECKLQQQQEIV